MYIAWTSLLLLLSLQSCPTLCDPIDGSPPGSTVPGILQARTLEWVAISFSRAWKWKVRVKSLSRVRLSATPWPAAHPAPPSMGFSRQECWSGVPLPSPWVAWAACMFWKLVLCQLFHLLLFSHILRAVFSPCFLFVIISENCYCDCIRKLFP